MTDIEPRPHHLRTKILPAYTRRIGYLRPGLRAAAPAANATGTDLLICNPLDRQDHAAVRAEGDAPEEEEDGLSHAMWRELRDLSPGGLGGWETVGDVAADRLPRIVGSARVALRAVEALA